MKDIQIGGGWKEKLENEFTESYFTDLTEFVRGEYLSKTVYPNPKQIFRAFDETPFESVKVVILGQDPYHGEGQANGLCFAVNSGVRTPPSLLNIFKELESDLGSTHSTSSGQAGSPQAGRQVNRDSDLVRWARQGVLLLNATLTVRSASAGSHQGKGWEQFTDAAIQKLNDEREGIVFILWGNYAKQKGAHIDRTKHFVIESAHPSPLSAHNGFFGSKPFSRANEYLHTIGKKVIDWQG